MSVLIKDMEIPSSCTMCWLSEHCGAWNIETVKHKGFNKRLDDCPLTELIRCEDCKYYPYGIRFCIDSYKHCKHMTDEGFCSWAVRKETR